MYPRGLCAGARAGYAVLVREIRVQVKLSNFADPSRRATAEMLVDTGATRVSLPSGLVRRLGLRKVAETQVEYADGRRARVPVVAPLRIAIDGRAAVTEAVRAPARLLPPGAERALGNALHAARTELHRHADVEAAEAVLALEPGGAREDRLPVVQIRVRHLDRRRGGRVEGRAGLEQGHDLAAR